MKTILCDVPISALCKTAGRIGEIGCKCHVTHNNPDKSLIQSANQSLLRALQNKWQTARALQKNGARLEGGLMIGVRPLDSLDRAAVEAGVDKSGAGGAAALAAWRAPPAQLPSRPYLLTQPAAARASQQVCVTAIDEWACMMGRDFQMHVAHSLCTIGLWQRTPIQPSRDLQACSWFL